MLEQLNLNNLALSVEAEVDFTPGMICITGETGAGKSLVVDALSLVLGAKADANMVRQGEKQLEVNARFSLKNQFKAIKLLDDYGFLEERNSKSSDQKIVNEKANTASISQDPDNQSSGDLISSDAPNLEQVESSEVDTAVVADGQAVGFDSWNMHDDDELLLRRIVTCEGKSKAYINGHPATLTQLREIGQLLVAVHGQHDGVRLMDGKRQLEIVDNFGKLRPLANEVNDAFNRYSKLRHDLTKLAEEQKAGAMTYKQDRYDLEELKRLDFAQGDYEELESMFDRAQHQAQFSYILGNLHAGIELNENSLVAILGKYLSSLDKVKAFDQRIDKIVENVDAAVQNLLEASGLAEDLCTHTLDVSITELEGRMTKAHELARRFSCLPKELYLMAERIENKINNFVSLRKRISDLTEEVKAARADYEAKAQELTKERKLASASLASKIEEKIKVLSLPDAKFDIELSRDEECKPRPSGRDELTFMFSANLGQGLRPLAAVASGGELSRLALAIEVLTASVNSTPTLIFDEIDTGISGRTALSVGELLNELGNYTQVITVTHLPQVAAKAHTQFVVAKYNEAGQVNSTITALNHDGRIEEISRMIGGSTITETTRQSARELLGFS
ncbi:MAG: DNA repair protein RecN [Anaerobiospirillum succiniciproducens]|uniref:DNA repair protein RecN n=1 Tax=Anaerobiospirillum succiniciproducens TaxID=13335 RepID=UPI0026DDAD8C|nr:DNA repair protein RecN [Anaerobiospirillum succiniciproducens]MDO4676004.1 DNA repair protein RecN [Anaerobiospirillum succiniciproducens]